MNVELHIEALVLDGFAPDDCHRIGAALKAELTHLFAEQGMPAALAHGGMVSNLEGGPVEVRPATRPEVVGARIAQAVYKGLCE